jgi:hypothetical protein
MPLSDIRKVVFLLANNLSRYRISRKMFLTILEGVRDYDSYFRCKPDSTAKLSFASYQKCFAAIRMLADGVASDLIDEYLRISETTHADGNNSSPCFSTSWVSKHRVMQQVSLSLQG